MDENYQKLGENAVIADNISEAIDEAKRDANTTNKEYKGFVVINSEELPTKRMFTVARIGNI